MGRWIDWRVTEDFTRGELENLVAMANGPMRAALPVVARNLRADRQKAPDFVTRLATWMLDRGTVNYARRQDIIVVKPRMITVKPESGRRDLSFLPRAIPRESGHTVGFQDFASIGVLAAASHVSGKVAMLGGDDIDHAYVCQIIDKLGKAGFRVEPSQGFLDQMER